MSVALGAGGWLEETDMAIAIMGVGVAIAMLACMQGWNAAAHRQDERTTTIVSVLFYVLAAVLFVLLVKVIFFFNG